jgi:PDZ domain-containing protein
MLEVVLRRRIWVPLLAFVGVLAFALFVWALVAPSDSYLLMPDRAHPLAPVVTVQGGSSSGSGGFYFVDVLQRKATWAERVLPFLRGDGTIVPEEAVVPDQLNSQQREQLDRMAMSRSQKVAAAVSLRALGYRVRAQPAGVLVTATIAGTPAGRTLVPGQVVVAVDGRPVRTVTDFESLIQRHGVGGALTLTVREGTLRTLTLRTIADPGERRRAIIGVLVTQEARIRLPLRVKIRTGDVVGPSAGLAFALELVDKLGRDIDRGYEIAATGELNLDGSVDPIGGIREKTIGARRSGIEIMLVPAGENAAVARRYAEGIRIIPVTSFQQALHALATLPRDT